MPSAEEVEYLAIELCAEHYLPRGELDASLDPVSKAKIKYGPWSNIGSDRRGHWRLNAVDELNMRAAAQAAAASYQSQLQPQHEQQRISPIIRKQQQNTAVIAQAATSAPQWPSQQATNPAVDVPSAPAFASRNSNNGTEASASIGDGPGRIHPPVTETQAANAEDENEEDPEAAIPMRKRKAPPRASVAEQPEAKRLRQAAEREHKAQEKKRQVEEKEAKKKEEKEQKEKEKEAKKELEKERKAKEKQEKQEEKRKEDEEREKQKLAEKEEQRLRKIQEMNECANRALKNWGILQAQEQAEAAAGNDATVDAKTPK